MKCPYKNFDDCLVEKCPACNYKTREVSFRSGRRPNYMSEEDAINRGLIDEGKVEIYEFVSCKLVDNCVQPVPENKQVINNSMNTVVSVKRSIF